MSLVHLMEIEGIGYWSCAHPCGAFFMHVGTMLIVIKAFYFPWDLATFDA